MHLASQICCSLNWRTLEQRRVDFGVCMLYKIRNHLIAAEEEHYVQRRTGRRSHQYRQLRADRYYTRFFFFPRTIIQWNQLSSQTCMTSRSTSSRHRSWRSTIQDSINFQDIFSFHKYCYTLSRGLCAGIHCTHPFSQCANHLYANRNLRYWKWWPSFLLCCFWRVFWVYDYDFVYWTRFLNYIII